MLRVIAEKKGGQSMGIYPDCQVIARTIEIGGLTKPQLIEKMQQHSIKINEYGARLLSDATFQPAESITILSTAEMNVRDLGFPDGAVLPQIYKRADELGLKLCPIETGPYLRILYPEQPEGNSVNTEKRHQAPSGSVTIASVILHEEDEFPKGFYLRKMDGELWLRGYIADDLHMWNPDDRFIFCL